MSGFFVCTPQGDSSRCGICHQHTLFVDAGGSYCTTCGNDCEGGYSRLIADQFRRMGMTFYEVSKAIGFPVEEVGAVAGGKQATPEFQKAFFELVRVFYAAQKKGDGVVVGV